MTDAYSAERARLSNDANIACMGAFTTGSKERELFTQIFLTNEFVPGCGSQPKVDAFRKYDMERKVKYIYKISIKGQEASISFLSFCF